LAHEWGRSGAQALSRLQALTDRPDLTALIASVTSSPSRFRFEQQQRDAEADENAQTLAERVPVRPADHPLHESAFDEVPPFRLNQWREGCDRTLPDGRAGCVLVLGAFLPNIAPDAQGIMVFRTNEDRSTAHFVQLRDGRIILVKEVFDIAGAKWPELPGSAVGDVLDGGFSVRSSGLQALIIGNTALVPNN